MLSSPAFNVAFLKPFWASDAVTPEDLWNPALFAREMQAWTLMETLEEMELRQSISGTGVSSTALLAQWCLENQGALGLTDSDAAEACAFLKDEVLPYLARWQLRVGFPLRLSLGGWHDALTWIYPQNQQGEVTVRVRHPRDTEYAFEVTSPLFEPLPFSLPRLYWIHRHWAWDQLNRPVVYMSDSE